MPTFVVDLVPLYYYHGLPHTVEVSPTFYAWIYLLLQLDLFGPDLPPVPLRLPVILYTVGLFYLVTGWLLHLLFDGLDYCYGLLYPILPGWFGSWLDQFPRTV